MTWETVPLRGSGVSIAWRKPGGQGAGFQIALTISSGVCAAMGAEPGTMIVVQRDRAAGKLRLLVGTSADDGARRMTWKETKNSRCAQLFVPLKDVQQVLREQKPAQTCGYEVERGSLTISLPHWACPLIQVSGGARAIPLRDGRAA